MNRLILWKKKRKTKNIYAGIILGMLLLAGALQGKEKFTVFAQTNDAFAKLNQTILGELVNNSSKKNVLANILKYHVVPVEVTDLKL